MHAQRIASDELRSARGVAAVRMDSMPRSYGTEAYAEETSADGYAPDRRVEKELRTEALHSARSAIVRGARKAVSAKIKKIFICIGNMPD